MDGGSGDAEGGGTDALGDGIDDAAGVIGGDEDFETAVANARKVCGTFVWDRRPATRRELVRDLYAAIEVTGYFEHEPR